MESVRNLTSFVISLTVLSIFILSIFTPTFHDNLIPNETKTEDTATKLSTEAVISEEESDPIHSTINALIMTFPLFLSIGGLLIIIQKFKRKE